MSIPDYISPIVGYRVWTWDTKGLKSLCGERWHPSQSLAARCRASAVVGSIVGRAEAVHDAHEPPQTNCTCGVYAARTIEHLHQCGYKKFGIHGEVYLWGTVVEHERGWRALGRGIAVVEHVDSKWIFAAVWNKCELRIARKEIVWDERNMRWETDANAPFECPVRPIQ